MKKFEIYYLDWDKTDRDERWEATMRGAFVGVDKYTRVGTYEAESDTPFIEIFEEFNIGNRGGYPVRSMSVGDILVAEGVAYLCAQAGWETLDLTEQDIERLG